jgi:hypothetical protein
MQRFIVKYEIYSHSDNHEYYRGPIAKEIFEKYKASNQLIYIEDKIIENVRYVTLSYDSEDSFNSLTNELKEKVISLGSEIKNKDAVILSAILGYQEVS